MKELLKRSRRPVAFAWAALLAALLLAGCFKVGPDYVRPDIQMPPDWEGRNDASVVKAADPQALARWWAHLGDPLLTDLVE